MFPQCLPIIVPHLRLYSFIAHLSPNVSHIHDDIHYLEKENVEVVQRLRTCKHALNASVTLTCLHPATSRPTLTHLPYPHVVGEFYVVVLAQHASSVALDETRVQFVRDLGRRERPLQLVERRQVELVVLGDARHVQRHATVGGERDAVHAHRLPAVAMEQVAELVRRLVVVARHDADVVRVGRRVQNGQRREWPLPVPRL